MENDFTGNGPAFLGAITAGATHELSNVLAIIQQSAGLMQDLCSLSPEKSFPHQETIVRSLEAIDRQLQRGAALLSCLNRFAHSADRDRASLNLWELINRMLVLCRRNAGMKSITLALTGPNPGYTLVTHPLHLEMALFSAIQVCLDGMTAPGQIQFTLTERGNRFTVHLSCSLETGDSAIFSDSPDKTPLWQSFVALVNQLGGEAESFSPARGICVHLPAET
ncbi:MAG: hypothetical protein ABIK68_22220 [bacterium]